MNRLVYIIASVQSAQTKPWSLYKPIRHYSISLSTMQCAAGMQAISETDTASTLAEYQFEHSL